MSSRRRAMRHMLAIAACALAPAVAACSVEATLPPPYCSRSGSALIVAQSVPTASQIPCFQDLPTGWTFASVLVNERHTLVTLNSDRVGDGAAVLRYDETCDTSDAVPAPSDHPAAERFDEIAQLRPGLDAKQYYVFPGGCVWWTFDFDSDTSATQAVAVDDALQLVSRDDLNEQLRETFVDEEI